MPALSLVRSSNKLFIYKKEIILEQKLKTITVIPQDRLRKDVKTER